MKKLTVNYIGQIFGNLTILSKTTKKGSGRCYLYRCLCVCGNKVNVPLQNLKIGDRKNCSYGCKHRRRVAALIGKEINNRMILCKQGAQDNGQYLYKVRCKCGKESIASEAALKRSNGCNFCGNITHGHCKRNSVTRVHRIWTGMKARCLNPNVNCFEHYGGRGIKVCDRWLSFDNFLADMGEPPENLSLERINNDGNYEPENCKWATQLDQVHNRSIRRISAFTDEQIRKEYLKRKVLREEKI